MHCDHLLYYCAANPNVGLYCYASKMILSIESNASLLVALKAKSYIAGFFSLESRLRTLSLNDPIPVEYETLKYAVISVAEHETAVAFHNAQQTIPIQYILNQIGHPQSPTPLA